jgi:hypothetical protein
MRLLALLEYTLVIVGIIGMIAAHFFFLPKGFHLGIFLIGAGLALGGLESLFTRRMSFRFATHGGAYGGAPAVIWGVMLLSVGSAVVAAAYLMEEGLWRSTVNAMTRRPGPAIAAAGLLACGAGALLMFNRIGHGMAWTLFVRIPKTLLGLLLIVAGVAAVGLGIVEWIDHEAYLRVSRRAGEVLYLDRIQRLWRDLTAALF